MDLFPISGTKLSSLHSASTWPAFRLSARSVALKLPRPRARLSANWLDAVSRKTGLPKTLNRHVTFRLRAVLLRDTSAGWT
jgi:hypothetical protein